jgi:hypothetical protein
MKFNPNNKTRQILMKLSEFVLEAENKFFYTVMGGIAVDGYAGKLTRNHPDVDMLIFRQDIKKLESVLEKLNYAFEYFDHPQEPGFKYKIKTRDAALSFQIIDEKADNKFEISFYRDLQLTYPMNFIKPQSWLELGRVRFPAVSKQFLIKLKENEIEFFEKLKKDNPAKYRLKRKAKHLNCLQDLVLLEKRAQ